MPWHSDQAEASTGGGAVQELFDFDTAAQGDVDLKAAGDGAVTIAGFEFDAFNTSNAAEFGLVNGSGLQYVVEPADFPASNIRPTTAFTGPMLKKTLQDIDGFDPSLTKIELTAQFSGTFDQQYEQITIGFASNFTAGIQAWQASIGRRREASTGFLARWGDAGGGNFNFNTTLSGDYMKIVFDPLTRWMSMHVGSLGPGDVNYPSVKNWTYFRSEVLNYNFREFGFRPDAVFFFGFSNSDGATSNDFTGTINRMRGRLIY